MSVLRRKNCVSETNDFLSHTIFSPFRIKIEIFFCFYCSDVIETIMHFMRTLLLFPHRSLQLSWPNLFNISTLPSRDERNRKLRRKLCWTSKVDTSSVECVWRAIGFRPTHDPARETHESKIVTKGHTHVRGKRESGTIEKRYQEMFFNQQYVCKYSSDSHDLALQFHSEISSESSFLPLSCLSIIIQVWLKLKTKVIVLRTIF